MVASETRQLLEILEAIYPNFKITNPEQTLAAWQFMLAEYDYNAVMLALKTYDNVSGSAFAPSPAQLKQMINKPQEIAQRTDLEAWTIVREAIGRSIYYAEAEFEQLPEDLQSVIRYPSVLRNWAQMDSETIDSVVASNFQKTYRAAQKRASEYALLPQTAKKMADELIERKREPEPPALPVAETEEKPKSKRGKECISCKKIFDCIGKIGNGACLNYVARND